MKRIYLLVIFMIGMFLTPITAVAALSELTVEDMAELAPETAASVIADLAKKKADLAEAKIIVSPAEEVDKWVDLLARLGKGLAAMAGGAGVAVNEFVKTPVGIMAAGVLLWKLVGTSMAALLAWIISTIILCWSFTRFHIPKRQKLVVRNESGGVVLDDAGKPIEEVKYVRPYEFDNGESRSWSAACHAGLFTILSIIFVACA